MANVYNVNNYSDALLNYTMIDGLTPDIIKRKYIWLLNAIVDNAIIGQDDYGLVWYSGSWIAGEWEDGTWYSGMWYDGEWKNGNFYSYRFDTKQLMQRNVRILEKNNPIYSQFRHGIWRRGNFYNGYFGPEELVKDWNIKTDTEVEYYDTRWESGIFYNGVFRNATWNSNINTTGSVFKNGIFYNSEWTNGTFVNGTFQGYEWWNGNFTGGDFTGDPLSPYSGVTHWWRGSFNQTSINIKSRFGSYPVTGTTNLSGTSVIWHSGDFYNGEFHSGLNIVSGVTQTSDNHNRTAWITGTWHNGTWYGGTYVDGTFNSGSWIEGFWSGGTFNNGNWYNGFWLNGVMNGGVIQHGLFKNIIVNHGELGYQQSQTEIRNDIIKRSKLSMNPKLYE